MSSASQQMCAEHIMSSSCGIGLSETFKASALVEDALAALSFAVRQLAIAIAVVIEHEHDLGRIADCDDRMLAGLKLNRNDLRSGLSEPLQDPSALLRCRIDELRAERCRFVRSLTITRATDPSSRGFFGVSLGRSGRKCPRVPVRMPRVRRPRTQQFFYHKLSHSTNRALPRGAG